MSQQNGLRVGVIGCGYWGSKHVRALSSLESVAKVSVIEPNAERADAILAIWYVSLGVGPFAIAISSSSAAIVEAYAFLAVAGASALIAA